MPPGGGAPRPPAWLRGEAAAPGAEPRILPDGRTDASLVRLLSSPSTGTYPIQRVMQVCLGSEHGVLVTDAGIPFTFGDNRYGQLGRDACTLSENREPFPVLDLLEQEIVQVAAGMHHCLALTASRFVWAWGRNKVGQLGCGDTRDKILPIKVGDPRGFGKPAQLGNIVTISAGGNSSVASSLSSEVWQWGEISNDFREKRQEPGGQDAEKSRKAATFPVQKSLPFCVFRREEFRSHMRKEAKSISETGCRVHGKMKPVERDHLVELFKSARKWRRSVGDARGELLALSSQSRGGEGDAAGGAPGAGDAADLENTVGIMQREIRALEREIYLLERNLEGCERQQKHLRGQIMGLAGQGARLAAKEDQVSLSQYEGRANERTLEREMADIKALIEANHSTRTTLLEQRTETDKERQRVERQLQERRRLREEQERRLQKVRELQRDVDACSAASDSLLERARQVSRLLETRAPAEGRGPGDFPEAMAAAETTAAELSAVEARLRELARGHARRERGGRAAQVAGLLQSLVELHRARNSLAADRWARDDLDLSSFLGGPGVPQLAKARDAPRLWA